jgi:hypothetical protein
VFYVVSAEALATADVRSILIERQLRLRPASPKKTTPA